MKKLLVIILFFCFTHTSFAWNKKSSIEVIAKAKNKINSLSDNTKLANYIPFKEYSDAFINLVIAQNELNKENFILAYYYANITIIQLDAILILAQIKELDYKTIVYEKDHYKAKSKKKKAPVKKINSIGAMAIIAAHLFQKGNVYRVIYNDRDLFKRRSYHLSTEGRDHLFKLLDVLNLHPECRIKIIGHTRYKDYKNRSTFKSNVVASFFKKQGIAKNRIINFGIGNIKAMPTVIGVRRVSRIEIQVSGIDLTKER